MKTAFTTVTVAALLLVAGCGSSNSSSSSTSSSTPAATSTSSSSAGSTNSGSAASSPEIAQAVAACKQSIASQPTISATLKTKLDGICDEAGKGNQAAVKKATHDVCVEIVKEKIPAAQQQAAEAACPAA